MPPRRPIPPRAVRKDQLDLTRLCTERGAGIADLPIERIAQAVRPSDEQRALLDELKSASAKASEGLKGNCPAYQALTPTGRAEAMEKRLSGHARGGEDGAAGARQFLQRAERRAEGALQYAGLHAGGHHLIAKHRRSLPSVRARVSGHPVITRRAALHSRSTTGRGGYWFPALGPRIKSAVPRPE